MEALRPVNQKSVYHSWADLYQKLMNGEISELKAETAGRLLAGMNLTFMLELKRKELMDRFNKNSVPTPIRMIELKEFESPQDQNFN